MDGQEVRARAEVDWVGEKAGERWEMAQSGNSELTELEAFYGACVNNEQGKSRF